MIALNIACFVIALLSMEAVAWATHRWIMHGPMWNLHRSHHRPHEGALEANDLFAVGFAAIAILMFWVGSQPGWGALTWAAAGVTSYGFLYAVVHDGLVHQRWPFRVVPRRGYLKNLVQAHRLHHAVNDKEGAVSFGFLAPQDVRKLSLALKRRHRERSEVAPESGTLGRRPEPFETTE